MFNYGLDQYVEFHLWEREREIRALRTVARARVSNDNRCGAFWTVSERILVHIRRLFARLSHVPHGRVS